MKGVIFNLLESFICETWGDELYEEVLSLCPLTTREPFVGPGTYPDEDLLMISTNAAAKLGLSLEDALRAFGKYCFPRLAHRFSSFIDPNSTAKEFLLSVDSVIHVEVNKLYPNSITPKFEYDDSGEPNELIINYRSKRKLCTFMEGLIEGVSVYFQQNIQYSQRKCTCDGNDFCEFHLTFG